MRHLSDDDLRDVHRGGVAQGSRRSVLTMPLVWLIRLYQHTFSRMLGPVCRYYPSCSAYGVTSLERHGLLRGSRLTVRRVLRCHPWARGGVDHVPPARRRPHPLPATHDFVEASTSTSVSTAHPRA